MRILIHPRDITADTPELRDRVADVLETALSSVQGFHESIDVYLTDVNGPRGGPDKRCQIVAQVSSERPVVSTAMGRDPVATVLAAANRCRRQLRNRWKRRRDRRRRRTASTARNWTA
jgi:putative sigma-54 modulation protein